MVYSEDECLAALRAAATEFGGLVSRREYKQGSYVPSASVIVDRFGSWNEAKRAAGLPTNRGGREPKPVRTNYFAEIDSVPKAYWLGFLFGDGQMMLRNSKTGKRSVRLSISERDIDHLHRYRRAIRSEAAVVEDGDLRSVTVGDQVFAAHLLDKGFTRSKGTDGALPSLDSWRLRRGFVRGLSDADGFVGEHKWTITDANDRRLRALRDWIPVEYDIVTEQYEDRSWAYLRVSGRAPLAALYGWLYPVGELTEPALPRKRAVAARLLEQRHVVAADTQTE